MACQILHFASFLRFEGWVGGSLPFLRAEPATQPLSFAPTAHLNGIYNRQQPLRTVLPAPSSCPRLTPLASLPSNTSRPPPAPIAQARPHQALLPAHSPAASDRAVSAAGAGHTCKVGARRVTVTAAAGLRNRASRSCVAQALGTCIAVLNGTTMVCPKSEWHGTNKL